MAEEKEIGKITHYYDKLSVAIIELKSELKAGDEISIKGANDDLRQVVDSIEIDRQGVDAAKKGDIVGIKVAQKVHEGSKVFK